MIEEGWIVVPAHGLLVDPTGLGGATVVGVDGWGVSGIGPVS